MDQDLKRHLKSSGTWTRLLFMLLFLVIYGFAEAIWFLVVVFQFLHTLITGRVSEPVVDFNEDLCTYIYDILLYVGYNSDEQPFPFSPWPSHVGSQDNDLIESDLDDEYDDDDTRDADDDDDVSEPSSEDTDTSPSDEDGTDDDSDDKRD